MIIEVFSFESELPVITYFAEVLPAKGEELELLTGAYMVERVVHDVKPGELITGTSQMPAQRNEVQLYRVRYKVFVSSWLVKALDQQSLEHSAAEKIEEKSNGKN